MDNELVPFDRVEVGEIYYYSYPSNEIYLFVSDKTSTSLSYSEYHFDLKKSLVIISRNNTVNEKGYSSKFKDVSRHAQRGELVRKLMEVIKVEDVSK